MRLVGSAVIDLTMMERGYNDCGVHRIPALENRVCCSVPSTVASSLIRHPHPLPDRVRARSASGLCRSAADGARLPELVSLCEVVLEAELQ
jgi:hypothetical protein